MRRVKNNSIGMGLSCSKLIVNQLYGNLKLKESVRGKTVFRMEMPVEKRDKCLKDVSAESLLLESSNHLVLSNYKRALQA